MVVIFRDEVPYLEKSTGSTPSAGVVVVDAPSGEAWPSIITSSRDFLLGFNRRKQKIVFGSIAETGITERTMNSSFSPLLNRTGDFAPGNSEAVFMLITMNP